MTDRSMEVAVAAFIERRCRADGDFIEVLAETCREFRLREPGLGFVSQYGIQYARLESSRGYAEAAEFLAGCLLLRHRKLVQADKQARVRDRVKKAQGGASSTIRVRGIGDKLAFPVPEVGNTRYRFGKSPSTQRKRRRRAAAANDLTRALSKEIPPLPKTVGQKVKRLLRGDPRAVHRRIEQLPKAWRLPLFRAMRRRPDGSFRSLSDPTALSVFGLFLLFTQGAGKGVRGRRTQYCCVSGLTRAALATLLPWNPRTNEPVSERTITRYAEALHREGLVFFFQPGPDLLNVRFEQRELRVLAADFPVGPSGYAMNVYVVRAPRAVEAIHEAGSNELEAWLPVFEARWALRGDSARLSADTS